MQNKAPSEAIFKTSIAIFKLEMCARGGSGSACTSAQSDLSLPCPYEEPMVPYKECKAKTFARLRGCEGLSE